MRLPPTVFRSFSTSNNVNKTQTKSLNYVINSTAQRLVHGGFWKHVEPPPKTTTLAKFMDSLQQFGNRCRTNAESFARTSLDPIRVSCMESCGTAVKKLQTRFEDVVNLAERSALQDAISKQMTGETTSLTVKSPHAHGDGSIGPGTSENECRPLRRGAISAVRIMADFILPSRHAYTGTPKYPCFT